MANQSYSEIRGMKNKHFCLEQAPLGHSLFLIALKLLQDKGITVSGMQKQTGQTKWGKGKLLGKEG